MTLMTREDVGPVPRAGAVCVQGSLHLPEISHAISNESHDKCYKREDVGPAGHCSQDFLWPGKEGKVSQVSSV